MLKVFMSHVMIVTFERPRLLQIISHVNIYCRDSRQLCKKWAPVDIDHAKTLKYIVSVMYKSTVVGLRCELHII